MRKLFTALVYLATFAAPAMIVEYYDRYVEPMSSSDKRLAIIGGTIGILIMAVLTGFGRIGSVRDSGSCGKLQDRKGSSRRRSGRLPLRDGWKQCYEKPAFPHLDRHLDRTL